MTEQVTLALIASVTSTIAATIGAVLGYINTKKANVIHTVVNSNLDEVKRQLKEAQALISSLLEADNK